MSTKESNLLKDNPKLSEEWDYKRNRLRPEEVAPRSGKKFWWRCPDKNHSYDASPSMRNGKSNKTKCPYCSGSRIGYGNDLKTMYPEIAKEWDYDRNELNPENVAPRSNKKYFWICSMEKHSYQSSPDNRCGKNSNCPKCSGRDATKESNLKTRYPEIAKEWDYDRNKLNPEEIMPGNPNKFWWRCSDKNHSYDASPDSRIYSKTSCPHCYLPNSSKEEIYLRFELLNFFEFNPEDLKIKDISKQYNVDIKIQREKLIIEYDGEYWHRERIDSDLQKTRELERLGWTVIRVREKPLKILSRKYNVTSKSGKYKETSNKVLKKLKQLGYEVKDLDKYLLRKKLLNKKSADKHIEKLLKEKRSE